MIKEYLAIYECRTEKYRRDSDLLIIDAKSLQEAKSLASFEGMSMRGFKGQLFSVTEFTENSLYWEIKRNIPRL